MFDDPGDDDDTPVTNVLGVSASPPLTSMRFEECVFCGMDPSDHHERDCPLRRVWRKKNNQASSNLKMCYFCGQDPPDHFGRNCPLRLVSKTNYQKCYFCGEDPPDHPGRKCPLRTRNDEPVAQTGKSGRHRISYLLDGKWETPMLFNPERNGDTPVVLDAAVPQLPVEAPPAPRGRLQMYDFSAVPEVVFAPMSTLRRGFVSKDLVTGLLQQVAILVANLALKVEDSRTVDVVHPETFSHAWLLRQWHDPAIQSYQMH